VQLSILFFSVSVQSSYYPSIKHTIKPIPLSINTFRLYSHSSLGYLQPPTVLVKRLSRHTIITFTHSYLFQSPSLYHHIDWFHCASTLVSTSSNSHNNTIILNHNAFQQLQQQLLELWLEVKLCIRQAFAQVIIIRYIFNE
jgi:hypothetical protein